MKEAFEERLRELKNSKIIDTITARELMEYPAYLRNEYSEDIKKLRKKSKESTNKRNKCSEEIKELRRLCTEFKGKLKCAYILIKEREKTLSDNNSLVESLKKEIIALQAKGVPTIIYKEDKSNCINP